MFKLIATVSAFLAAGLLLSAMAGAQEKDQDRAATATQRLTLKIEGVECAGCARVMSAVLQETDLKITSPIKPNPEGASQVAANCPVACDLGAAAAKVNAAQTPHREKVRPSLSLVLFADPSQVEAKDALAACRKIKGIDAEACKYESETGQLQLTVTGKEKISPTQIVEALADAGIEVSLSEPSTEAKTPE